MPTGYTYPVCEGKITEFPDFALSCARAFGALISMREEPMDAPLPDEIAASTNYYDQKIEESQKRLGEVQAMTNADADAAADAAYGAALKSRDDYLASKRVEAERLNAMEVRLGCRSLARKGLAEFGKGLWDDEGPAGSGYCATKQGRASLASADGKNL